MGDRKSSGDIVAGSGGTISIGGSGGSGGSSGSGGSAGTGAMIQGMLVNMLTGGRLARILVQILTASPDAIIVYSLDLTTIAALLDGPKSEVARSRDRLANSWQATSGGMTRDDLDLIAGCVNDVKAALLEFSASVRRAADEIKSARDKLNQIIAIGDGIAAIQLKVPFIGWSLATVTAIVTVGAVAVVLFKLNGKLNEIAETMLVDGAERAAGITTRAEQIAPETGTTGLRNPAYNSHPFTGRTLTVFDRP